MITELEAQDLVDKYKTIKKNNPQNKIELKKIENECMSKFSYLINSKMGKYLKFSNAPDIRQEGFEGLIKAIKTYDKSKGSFFWWAHKYIDTRIYRSVNAHSTIVFPLKIAKETKPQRESYVSNIIDQELVEDKDIKQSEAKNVTKKGLSYLNDKEAKAVKMYFGIDGNKVCVSKIADELDIPKPSCQSFIDNAIVKIQNKIKE